MFIPTDFFKLFELDKNLHTLYEKYGLPQPRPQASGFWALVRIINAQLISTHAANTILKRIESMVSPQTAIGWQRADKAQIRTCGMTQNKLNTITALADDIVNGVLDLDTLATQDTQTIHTTLTAYKGIGNWSANAFALTHRSDVFLYDDLGVRDGVKIALRLTDRPTSVFCKEYYEKHWQPYGSCATYFMWHIKDS